MIFDNNIATTRDYLMTIRQALLLQLEAIEKLLEISPRTSEIRKLAKEKTEKQVQNDDTVIK